MNKKDLETMLNVSLKGHKCSNYFMHSEIERVLQSYIDETEPTSIAKVSVFRHDNRSAYFDVYLRTPRTNGKSFCFFVIEVKRTRDWRDDYYYKDFRVCQDDLDIEKAVDKHLEAVKRDNEKVEAKMNEARKLYWAIRDLYPSESKFAVRNKVKYLMEHIYSIEDEERGD